MTITYPDYSGNQHSMTFNDNAEALAHLRLLESAEKKEKEAPPLPAVASPSTAGTRCGTSARRWA